MKIRSVLFYHFLTLFVFSITMHTQGQGRVKNYDAEWKTVEEFQKKALSKSALEEVKKIYQLAKKEKQDAQLVKAAIYMVILQSETRENNEVASIRDLEADLAGSSEPVKSILSSLVADQYYFYYQSIRWQLYQRTATANYLKEDIRTWGTADFHSKITELYLASIQHASLLKQTKLDPFEAIITKGNTRKLRPTLYDLLTHSALKYFSSDERDLKKPAYAFEIDTASAFDPAAVFIHRKFETRDSTSMEFFALQLYQKLIAFHINDPEPDAFIDVDLQRLQYVKSKSVHPDADQLYFMAINHVAEQYQQAPAAAQAWYLVASYYQKRGDRFEIDRDSTYRFEKVKAVQICEKVIHENAETEGGINAYNLLHTIRAKELQFEVEHVNIPQKPFLVFVKFKNFPRLYLRLVKTTGEINLNNRNNGLPQTWKTLLRAPLVRAWEQPLPDTKDYQDHGIEIKVEGLPVGQYMLLASSNSDFNENKALVGARMIHISNISYVQNEADFFVLNRDTGQPLPGANVRMWYQSYDYSFRTYKKVKGALYTTDKNGYFGVKEEIARKKAEAQSLEITYEQDKLFIEEPIGTYYNPPNIDEQDAEIEEDTTIYLFTDRSLYRPGQTVYYKGIARAGNAVLKDHKQEIDIVLQNANGESVAESTKTVNEYGSFSGSFVLPQGTLNGAFSLWANNEHSVHFRVEEYKRPKFSVQFDTLTNSYKLNDAIKVAGTATAYAGNQIDGAKVSYRVVRNARFPYYGRSYRWWNRPSMSESQELTHGETTTDVSGRFTVNFKALPDKQIDKELDPVFDYAIYADVTDSNGETRSSETIVSAGYKSIVLKSDIAEILAADSLKNLSVRAENMNGKLVSVDVTVKITSLIPEKRLIRARYWERPDLFIMSKPEFLANFPHDEYDDETEMETWPELTVMAQQTARLAENQKFSLPGTKFAPGFYKIEISAEDENKEKVKDIKYIELTDPKSDKLLRPDYLQAESSSPIEPGEATSIKLATSADELFVITNSSKKPVSREYKFFSLNDQKKTLNFSATEADRGGYGVSYLFVKHNRIHQHQEVIQVPGTNKDLKINYETFRDKTLPGSKEAWKIRISGYKQDKVAAEMLAGMYDASLDQFYMHQWTKPDPWPVSSGITSWNANENFSSKNADILDLPLSSYKSFDKEYDELLRAYALMNSRPGGGGGGRNVRRRMMSITENSVTKKRGQIEDDLSFAAPASPPMEEKMEAPADKISREKPEQAPPNAGKEIAIRKNFNETAFFYPDLKTDEDGSISFSFTLPEALTRWKFQALAHTKELAFGYSLKEIITQKEIMVQPNAPRFLREGDRITFPAKVVNLSDRALTGKVSFQLFDTETNQRVDDIFKNDQAERPFDIPAGQSITVGFPIEVPKEFTKMLTWRIVAKSADLSDGEEDHLPVLSNRMLVTESMPISMRGTGSKNFKFEKLLRSEGSKTLKNHSLTIEYTSNPAWYAIQSLPYLMEYPYECAEQTWNRYYANSLGAHIAGSSPRIAKIFDTWRTADTTALLSNLEKNQELKSVLLEETPWVLAAKTEARQKQNIALLFDLVRMGKELNADLDKLIQLQSENGGFVWFKGGPDDRYMTQYIVAAIGHLKKTNAIEKTQEDRINQMLLAAITYLDKRMKEDYDRLKNGDAYLKGPISSPIEVHYLYARSFFPELRISAASQKAYTHFRNRAKATWAKQSQYLQGMTALVLHRTGDPSTPKAILKSLKETAVYDAELGMYWKSNRSGWWHEAPVEQQALFIEVFQEISGDNEVLSNLKTWLLKNKQTNSWESTKATAEACYALLLGGSNWLSDQKTVSVKLGEAILTPAQDDAEAGTGYFKKAIESDKITAEAGNIRMDVTDKDKSSSQPSWGAVYWQYFEDLDHISFAETPFKLSKKLFIEKNTDNGPVLSMVNEGDTLHIGDKIKVRIELRADRGMEYVHMKDMRASALEPVHVLSSYKWQNGLGYYETTKDASTNFFFSYVRKGTHVFEYPLFVTHEGNFSNGITSVQCMYAPEFSAHSEGVRIKVVRD
ncbi:alpha-2-macroglobulin [Dyadobacter sp. CY323]|uniref:alpha-2-macroglobulin family protein n=1 Tax=Dyadobacter sp. CY323 TaxID=2907302 RepID=UPI001F202502|nr:alpha-2-macroglobulin family protein [Dyadobacter sp. CY323]MCE6992271.1 MG2 domain-containing protein [Dyadobacter sp. CY323]